MIVDSTTAFKENTSSIWDPTALVDENTGTVHVLFGRSTNNWESSRRADTWVVSSIDNGATWSDPRNITDGCMGAFPGSTPNGGHGIQVKRGVNAGRLIVPLYNLLGASSCSSDDESDGC